MDTLYFAYGSNINLEQMAYRCPDATVVEPVTLENYELLFPGNGRGNGVATIAPKKGSKVHGLLWRISLGDEQNLDFYEGFPHLYEKQSLCVKTPNGVTLAVMAYVMTREKERCPTVPSPNYYLGILEGFQQNSLPQQALKQALRHVWREVDALAQTNQKPKKGRETLER